MQAESTSQASKQTAAEQSQADDAPVNIRLKTFELTVRRSLNTLAVRRLYHQNELREIEFEEARLKNQLKKVSHIYGKKGTNSIPATEEQKG